MKGSSETARSGCQLHLLVWLGGNQRLSLLNVTLVVAARKIGIEPMIKGRMQSECLGKLRFGFHFCRIQNCLCFLGADFMHEEIAPANFPAMRLQHDGTCGRQRLGSLPIILHHRAIHDRLVVQPNPSPCPDLSNAELIPVAERFVGEDQRIPAGRTGCIVEKSTGTEVRLAGGIFGIEDLMPVPDLHLRCAAQVNAAVRFRDGLVFKAQLDIAEFRFGRGVRSGAAVDQLAVLDSPMLGEVGPLLLEVRLFLLSVEPGAAVRVPSIPTRQVLAVENGSKASGRIRFFRGAGWKRGRHKDDDDEPVSEHKSLTRIWVQFLFLAGLAR